MNYPTRELTFSQVARRTIFVYHANTCIERLYLQHQGVMTMTSTMSTSSAGARPAASPLMASLYGGVATGLIGAAFMMLLSAKLPILYGLAFILIGAGPVLGYQLAAANWVRLEDAHRRHHRLHSATALADHHLAAAGVGLQPQLWPG
jgi:hypothetical protein